MKVVYFLPKFSFFTNRLRGRTSHAHGFLTGLKKNNINCLLVSGPGYAELYKDNEISNPIFSPRLISRINLFWVAYAAIQTIRNRDINCADHVLVVRYSTSAAFLTSLLFGLFWKGTTVYEINSIGYHQLNTLPQWLLKPLLTLEKRLISAFDKALCVSSNIRFDIAGRGIDSFVVPNGSAMPAVKLKTIHREKPRFIYLGAYQPYYDFQQLFHCFSQAKTGGELHIYGDKHKYLAAHPELDTIPGMKLKGAYNLRDLLGCDTFSRCDIFLLPNGRNGMARIGSPTKLFEYLAFGSRIIYQDFAQAGEILGTLEGTYPYRDDESLIAALQLLAQQFNQPFVSPVSEEVYQATFTWEARVRLFLEELA